MPVTTKPPVTGSTAPTTTPPVHDTLFDQLQAPVKTIGKGAKKLFSGVVGTGKKLKKAYDKWDGEEKTYALNSQTQQVEETVRGKDLDENGEEIAANGFQKELARDNLEKGIHKGIKTITGAGKSTSKSMGAVGDVLGTTEELLGVINPLKAASQMANGTHAMIKGGSEVYRFQKRKNAARKGEEEARAQNNPLAMGLQNTKRGLSSSRNESLANTGLGALEATTGSLGIAQFVDPTGGTAGAHKVLSSIFKGAKKINMVRRAIKFGRRSEKVTEMRQRADQGDPEAAKWLMENDPRMGSAQLLMHSQRGSEDSKQFAQGHVAKTLGLGDDAKKELETGTLGEFDKLYANRTGQDIESKMSHKEGLIYKFLKPHLDRASKVGNGIKNFFGGGKKKQQKGPQKQMSNNDIADQFTYLTQMLDQEQAKKKELGTDTLSHDQMDEIWNKAPQQLQKESIPDRARAEMREYNKVKDFRVEKTYKELVDDAEQKSLKERFKGTSDGSLFNIESFRQESSSDAIDKTIAFSEEATDFKKKASKKSAAVKDGLANVIGPWVKTTEMPEDIRQGLVAYEEKRRASGEQAGQNLNTTAPQTQDWEKVQLESAYQHKVGKINAKFSGDDQAKKRQEKLTEAQKKKDESEKELAKALPDKPGKLAKRSTALRQDEQKLIKKHQNPTTGQRPRRGGFFSLFR